jgi:hypothetical protein
VWAVIFCPKSQATKIKIDKWDYINLKKSFCTAKEIINRGRRQPKLGIKYLQGKNLILG